MATIPDSRSRPLRVAIAGQFQQGKSLVFNLLIGQVLTEVGHGLRTTVQAVEHPLSCNQRSMPVWQLIDTPGINHDGKDSSLADSLCRNADFLLWLAKDCSPSALDWEFMIDMHRSSIPVGILLNLDTSATEHSAELARSIWSKACSFFQPFPLSEMGVHILHPQRMDLTRIQNSHKLPQRLRRICSDFQTGGHPETSYLQSGFEELLSWFVPGEGKDAWQSDLLENHIALRKQAKHYGDRSKSILKGISEQLKTEI